MNLDIKAPFQFNSKCTQAFSHTDDELVVAIIEDEIQPATHNVVAANSALSSNNEYAVEHRSSNGILRQPRYGEGCIDATIRGRNSPSAPPSLSPPPPPPPPPHQRKRLVRVQSVSARQRFIEDRVLCVARSRDDRLVAIYGLHNILVYDARTELPAAHFGRPAHLPDEVLVDGVARSVGFTWVGLLRDRVVAVAVSSVYVWSVDGQQGEAKIRCRPGRVVQAALLSGCTGGCGGTRLITRTEGQREFDVWSPSSASLSSNSRQHSTPSTVTQVLAIGGGGPKPSGGCCESIENGNPGETLNNNNVYGGEGVLSSIKDNECSRLICKVVKANGEDSGVTRRGEDGEDGDVCGAGAILALSISADCKAVAVHSIRLGSLVDLLQHDDFVEVLACSASGRHVFTATRAQGNRAPKNRIWCLDARKVGREWSSRGALGAVATPTFGADCTAVLERGEKRAFVTMYDGHVAMRRSTKLPINELYSPLFLVNADDREIGEGLVSKQQYMVAFGLRYDCSAVGPDNRAICVIDLENLDNYYVTAGDLQPSTGAVKLLMV